MAASTRPISAGEAFETFKAYLGALERNDEKSATLVATVQSLEQLNGAEPEGVREQLTGSEIERAEAMYGQLYEALVRQNDFHGAATFHNQVAAFLDGQAARLEGQRNPGILSQRIATRLVKSLEERSASEAPPSGEPSGPRWPEKQADVERRVLDKWAVRGDVFFEEHRVLRLARKVEERVREAGGEAVTIEDASRLGSGAELRALVELLELRGYRVQTTEAGFYRRVDRIEVRAKS